MTWSSCENVTYYTTNVAYNWDSRAKISLYVRIARWSWIGGVNRALQLITELKIRGYKVWLFG